MIWRQAIVMQLCFVLPVFGSTFHAIDTTTPARCIFSSEGQNRILVEGGRIQKVVFPPGGVDVQMEEESGQVFVYALDRSTKPITLSVVTDLCDVQDIEIHFREDIPSEVVILLPVPSLDLPVESVCEESTQDIASVLRDILSQRVPLGYQCVCPSGDSLVLKRGVVAETLSRFDRDHESLYLFKVSNRTRFRQCIQEQDISLDGSHWIYLEKQTLLPKGSAIAVVAVCR